MAEVKPRHEIIIVDLNTAYGATASTKHKRQILAWKEHHVFKVKTYERLVEEFIAYRQRVVEAFLFVNEFITEIPARCHHDDGSYIRLDEVQNKFQSVVCNSDGGMSHISIMSTKFEKAANEIKDFLRSISDGEDILEKRNFAIDGIDASNRDTISNFLANVIEI